MKRALLILLLIPAMSFGQQLGLGVDAAKISHIKATSAGVDYEAEATALFARMVVQPDATRKGLIDDLIVTLKNGGVWEEADAMYVYWAHTEQASLLNWVADTNNCTNSGATFTADGYVSSGAEYLNTHYNPATADAVNLAYNDATIAVYVLDYTIGNDAIGCTDGSNFCILMPEFGGTVNLAYGFNSGETQAAAADTGMIGMTIGAGVSLFHNGTKKVTNRVPVATIDNNIYVMANNRLPSAPYRFMTGTVSFVFIGGGLTDGEYAILYTAIKTYLDAL